VEHSANILTLSRLVLAPFFIAVFLIDSKWAALGALLLAVLFELTDMLDGFFARNIGKVSSFGKLIDPLADSVARFSIFLAFTTEVTIRGDYWPILLVAVLFYRDAIVAYMRTFAASSGVVLAARVSGKIKAVIQGVGIMIFLSVRTVNYFSPALVAEHLRSTTFYAVMIPVAIVTALSGLDYVISNREAISKMIAADSP